MRFSVITPTAGLHDFATLSHTHLVLSHVTNELYWKFYTQLSLDPTQLLILDNSEYEGKQDPGRLFEYVELLRPKVLVMPDRLGLGTETFDLARNFLREYRHKLPCELMYVAQCSGTVTAYLDMKHHIQIMREMYGIKWFGLPRYLASHGISRSELCLWIKRLDNEWGDECYVHALGMANASLRELAELDGAQCDSIDSSAPVWRGWLGYGLRNREAWDKDGTQCDFDAHPNTLTLERRQLILANLKLVGIPVRRNGDAD